VIAQSKQTAFIKDIYEADNITLITHVNPDGDALGASLALFHFLQKQNKNVRVIVPNHVPEFLQWMPGFDQIIIFEFQQEEAKQYVKNSDLIVLLDFSALNRIEPLDDLIREINIKSILIDHHPFFESFPDMTISNAKVSSTAELIYELLAPIDKNALDTDIAISIYTGIMTDTVDFRYNVRQRTFQILADLLNYNIDIEAIHSNVYDKFSENRMNLLGYCLHQKLIVLPKYKTAYITITKDELKQFSFMPGDSEGFVNYPLSIKNITFSALFIEEEQFIKISFRSKGDFAVNKFADRYFNGGGHKNAAGGLSYNSLNETIEKFTSLLPYYETNMNFIN